MNVASFNQLPVVSARPNCVPSCGHHYLTEIDKDLSQTRISPVRWIWEPRQVNKRQIFKTFTSYTDRRSNRNAIHMVSAWASENGLVLGQIKTDEKSNEITAIPELLRALELNGCLVTIDAMGCLSRPTDNRLLDR